MSRYRLRSPEQPWLVRLILGGYEFAASLKLAVILIFSSAFVLAVGTFVESSYGTPAVQFGIYGTWWFTLLNALLGLNIFCAAAIRYPWKKHQTGFVITHIGLLTLLLGCLLSRRDGIDAQLPVFEGGFGNYAYEDTSHFELRVAPLEASAGGAKAETIAIPFACGPFNWDDIAKMPLYQRWLWLLAKRDQGTVYDKDGIKLEVLDYYSNCRQVDAPLLELAIQMPPRDAMDDNGKPIKTEGDWADLDPMSVVATSLAAHLPYGLGTSQMAGGGQINFWMTGNEQETQAFLRSQPEGALGKKGVAVVWAGGKQHSVSIDERLGQGAFDLGDSGYQAEVVNFYRTAGIAKTSTATSLELEERAIDTPEAEAAADSPAVVLNITKDGQPAGKLVLFDQMPYVNQQDYAENVFGTYWFDYGEKSTQELMAGQGSSRIDVLQGADQKLNYRYWNRQEVVAAAPLPGNGQPVDAFKMPMGQLKMKVVRHVPAAKPGKHCIPLPFNRDVTPVAAVRAAHVRLTVDKTSREFWMMGAPVRMVPGQRSPTEEETVASLTRSVTLAMPLDTVDVGFRVKLLDFERKLDPGTSQPSHYTSIVEFFDRNDDREIGPGETVITMNAPVDFSDPKSGKPYRLFQESFYGPFKPGQPEFDRNWDHDNPRESVFVSVLTVNADPGRGIKHAGTLLIVVGIGMMFYMRAYFFKPAGRKVEPADQKKPARENASEREPEPLAAS